MSASCPYCGRGPKLVAGDVVYPHRPDLHRKKFWMCQPCEAWVGCHQGTAKPLGILANAELRELRRQAHTAFDPLWQCGRMPRTTAYNALARYLGIKPKHCHIGRFNEEQCRLVIEFATTT